MPWFDGALHPDGRVPFDLADRGLTLADGVFDTALVLGGTMIWRAAHVARLVASAQRLGFAIEPARIEAAIDALLGSVKEGSLRTTATRGSGPRGLAPPKDPKPTVFATLAPLRRAALFAPLRLHTTSIRRNETSPTAQLKSLAYIDAILATREALDAGRDDALFLNTQGNASCTTIGNIFALFGDQVVTPPQRDGAIAGTARGAILRSGEDLGLEMIERSLSPQDLERADALFVSNSLRLVAPVTDLDRISYNSASSRRVEAIVALVAAQVREETGVDPRKLADG